MSATEEGAVADVASPAMVVSADAPMAVIATAGSVADVPPVMPGAQSTAPALPSAIATTDIDNRQEDDEEDAVSDAGSYYTASPQTSSPEHSDDDDDDDDDSDDEMVGPLLTGDLELDRKALARMVVADDEDDDEDVGPHGPSTKNELAVRT